jgi:DNA-binding NarL/FixJ family response regulator
MLSTLIVEDNATYRQSLHQLLAGRFPVMQIAEAADGEGALLQAFSKHFDLIFMDIHLPGGNGLNLTKTIKTAFADTMVCVITSYDILEYREAAFRNGADHFMVKGESTKAEIISLVETWLQTRFTTLIMVSDALYRKQLKLLLSIHWPAMIVEEALTASTAVGQVATLKPNMVLLELGLSGEGRYDLVHDIRAGSPHAILIGMTDDALPASHATATEHGVDYCVSLTPMGHTQLVTIINSIQPAPMHH